MGRIFIWAGQERTLNGVFVTEMLGVLQKGIAREFRFRHTTVLEVPLGMKLLEAIDWINARAQLGDMALALDVAAFSSSNVRGTTVFYIDNNLERRTQAEQLLQSVMKQVPSLIDRGVQPDTATETGSLPFIRQISIPSLVLSVGYISNLTDQSLIKERSHYLIGGIFDGLVLWKQALSARGVGLPFPPISININNQIYSEQGILVRGNAYIPADMIDQFAICIPDSATVPFCDYGGVTYVRAVDLRDADVFVRWDADTRTVQLQTLLSFNPKELGKIIGSGYLLPSDYEMFLNQVNPDALRRFPEIAQLYQEEAAIEGVNPDVAFAQALLEVNFLGFNARLKPEQNNFGGLGSTGGSGKSASFPNARTGVRAHIQHLKAYANEDPLVQEVVDPRFSVVTRGVAPTIEQLSRRWSAGANYGETILAILRRMYGAVGLI